MEEWISSLRMTGRSFQQKALVRIFALSFAASFFIGVCSGYYLQTMSMLNQPDIDAFAKESVNQNSFPIPATIAPSEVHYRFRYGDSFYQVLRDYGVPDQTISEWVKLAKPFYDLLKIKAGQEMWLRYGDYGRIRGFELGVSSRKRLVISEKGSGFVAEMKTRSLQGEDEQLFSARDHRLYYGEVISSFYQAGMDAGMDPELIMNLTNLFWGVIDFERQTRRGDQFWVMTETNPEGDERVLAMEIEANKKWYKAYYYKDSTGAGYYDEKGYALKGFYLIKPVAGARISSGFSYHRYHPVLHRRIPHLAVDYAAPAGTKVRAAADGVVIFAGWKGGFGNYLEIKHSMSFTTCYGHLKGFASGIKKGVRVKQGQTIGYVGMTGLATGPHLDYRVIRAGRNVNPTRVRSEKGNPVKDIDGFNQARQILVRDMENLKWSSLAFKPQATFVSLGNR